MNDMNRLDRAKTETLVLRLWQDSDRQGKERWRGSLIHPEAEKQVHFGSLDMLAEKITKLLCDIDPGGGGVGKE
jgi:hypothetical protein